MLHSRGILAFRNKGDGSRINDIREVTRSKEVQDSISNFIPNDVSSRQIKFRSKTIRPRALLLCHAFKSVENVFSIERSA